MTEERPGAEERPTRVALLTAGESLPRWAAAAVERLVADADAAVTLVVADASTTEQSTREQLQRLVELREWGVVAAAMELVGPDLDALDPVPVRDVDGLDDPEWVDCEPETVQSWKHQLPADAVDRLREADVAIRFGFGFLVGDALTAPEMGVLSFHHGDFREYRGQPMGFWEYVHGRETAGVTLQRLNETLDGGEVVATREVPVGDAPTWGAVRRRLFAASEDLLAEGVQKLNADGFEPERVPDEELADLYTLPRGWPVATYLRKTAGGVLFG
jgi:methionyl-tRNA formyltransferase